MTLMRLQPANRAPLRALLFGLFLGLLTSGSGPALAQEEPRGRNGGQEQAQLSAAQAARLVKQQYGGKVIKVRTHTSDRGKFYRVQLLQDSGRMRNVRVDAHTGAILN